MSEMNTTTLMRALYINAETAWAEYHNGQSKSVNVVYDGTEYVIFAADKIVLEEVERKLELAEIKGNRGKTSPNWHTGTPAEEGWYLLKVKSDDEIIYDTNRLIQCLCGFDWKYVHEEILEWQKIDENKE